MCNAQAYTHCPSFSVVPEVSVEAVSGSELEEGEAISLSCTVDGSLPQATQVQWLKDGTPFLTSSDRITITTSAPELDVFGVYDQMSTLVITDTHPTEDSGLYTCKAYLRSPGVPTVRADLSITVQSNAPHTSQELSQQILLNLFLCRSQ